MSVAPYIKGLAERFGVKLPEGDSDAALQATVAKMESDLRPHVLSYCGIGERDYVKRFRGIALRQTNDPNGYVHTSDNWKTFRITLNSGLLIFLHQMSKLVSSVVGIMGDEGVKEKSRIPFPKSLEVARFLMEAFWSERLRPGLSFALSDLSKNQVLFGAMMLVNMERFVVAHELGHVSCFLSAGPLEEFSAGQVMAKLTRSLAQHHEADWAEEFAADLVGFRLVIEAQNSDTMRMTAYGAIELFFILLDMLEKFHIKKRGPVPYRTHPPSELRFHALRRIASNSNPASILQFGDAFSGFAKKILEEV